jgi:ABC-type multidrug transport system ATPase subunit
MDCSVKAVKLYKDYKKIENKSYPNIFYKKHEKNHVIKNANFTIRGGESCALFGKNSCGKTTIIKLLSTLLLPTKGIIYINDYDIYKTYNGIRKIIGVADTEKRSFCWRLTGRQNLDFFAKLNNLSNKQSSRKIDELAEIFDTKQYLDDMFYNYSAGISKRFSIIRSLLHEPQIMFYDEPFKSLDQEICNRIKYFLHKLIKQQNKILFFTTLNCKEALDVTDRMFILNDGYLAENPAVF